MSRNIDLDKTLGAMRQTPIEIDFERVQYWVESSPQKQQVAQSWLGYLLAKIATWRPY